ncbi:MAG: tetratricopeptide repeat protein, partial [Opitutaceae bacterium]
MEDTPKPAALTDDRRFTKKDTLLFGFFRYRRIDGRVRVRPVWGRFFLGFLVLIVGGWLALSAGAWYFVTHSRGVKGVSYFDIALPFRWDEYRRKRGNDYLARAQAAQEKGEFREAYQLFRAGLAKNPANTAGRVRLATMLTWFGRPDMAIDVYAAGLPYAGEDLAFLSDYVQLLLTSQQDARLLQLVDEKSAAFPPESPQARLLGIAGATASFFRGDFAQAEAFVRRFELGATNEARLLQIRMEWERGLSDLALLHLRLLIQQSPGYEEAHAVLVACLQELGRLDEAESAAVMRSVAFPESAQAQVALLGALRDAGSTARLEREIENLLARAKSDSRLAAGAAEFAIQTANVALADRVKQMAADGALPPHMGALVSIEARLAARDYAGALSQLKALKVENPGWLEHQSATVSGLRAVALLGSGEHDAGELQLDAFLSQPGVRPENLVAIARRLEEAGAIDHARRVLTQVGSSKLNQAVLTSLIDLDIETGNYEQLVENLETLLDLRRPSAAFLRRAAGALRSDHLLFDPRRDAV